MVKPPFPLAPVAARNSIVEPLVIVSVVVLSVISKLVKPPPPEYCGIFNTPDELNVAAPLEPVVVKDRPALIIAAGDVLNTFGVAAASVHGKKSVEVIAFVG